MVDELVNKHQRTFIKGRQIMDVALIACEFVDSRFKGNEPGLMKCASWTLKNIWPCKLEVPA